MVMVSLNMSLKESSTPEDLVATVTGNRNTFYVLGLNVVIYHPVVTFFFTNLANFLFSSIWKCVLALSHHQLYLFIQLPENALGIIRRWKCNNFVTFPKMFSVVFVD